LTALRLAKVNRTAATLAIRFCAFMTGLLSDLVE
jgi:hypothetical protein